MAHNLNFRCFFFFLLLFSLEISHRLVMRIPIGASKRMKSFFMAHFSSSSNQYQALGGSSYCAFILKYDIADSTKRAWKRRNHSVAQEIRVKRPRRKELESGSCHVFKIIPAVRASEIMLIASCADESLKSITFSNR